MDSVHPTYHYVSALLERGVRVLVYVGEYDWICNWVGNSRWTEELEWSGGDAYRKVPMGTWELDGKTVGRYKSSGDLTFATIHGAGHMVC
jgi:carboxypeptidase C (cathepsin A)